MIVLFEGICRGLEHAPFNAALLLSVACGYPDEEIVFIAEHEHINCVQARLKTENISRFQWRECRIAPRHSGAAKRFLYDWLLLKQVFAPRRRESACMLIACSMNHSALIALKLRALAGFKSKIAIVHHSGLNSLLGSRTGRVALSFQNGDRILHLVLGEAIRRNVCRHCPELSDNLRVIDHPYLFPSQVSEHRTSEVVFGFLGIGSHGKGFDLFCRLAADSQREPCDLPAQFVLVGAISKEFLHKPLPGSEYVTTDPTVQPGGFIGPENYDRQVARVTYAVLPYSPVHYSSVMSGALLDAFSFGKPCIAIRNSVFDEYFTRMGDIGYLCDSYRDLLDTVIMVRQRGLDERYRQQRANILRAREIFSPEQVGSQLRTRLFKESGTAQLRTPLSYFQE
jgi:hypothetical protein